MTDPTKFLNSLEISGMPPHILKLKIGAPVMVLQNINPLYTPLQWHTVHSENLRRNCIEVTIATGHCKGSDVFLPRIPLILSDPNILFEFMRLQVPVRVYFAMLLNIAQGQSLTVAGLYLQSPCFSHGQYYAGCTQVGSPRNLFICAPGGETRNVLHKEAL